MAAVDELGAEAQQWAAASASPGAVSDAIALSAAAAASSAAAAAGGLSAEMQQRAARKRTERLVNFRDRSESELRQRLRQAGFSEAVAEREVRAAVAIGLVDDLRFTRLYIAGKKHSGWGRIRIENGLKRYGIDLRDTEGYPESVFSSVEELERACLCLEGFKTAAKDVRQAAFRRLLAKGYSLEVAQRAVKASALAIADGD